MKKHTFWLIELAIWATIIVFFVVGMHYYNAIKINNKNTYHIFIKDIDGLMEGSPVKIMGVQIGFVTEINVIDDYMYISFLVTEKGINIPFGAKTKIESYGIAGSKSIELYPPTEEYKEYQDLLFISEPIRASDSFKTQNIIAKTLIAVSEGTTSMLDTQTLQQHKANIQKLTELSNSDFLNSVDKKSDDIIKKIQNKENKRGNYE